MNKNDNILAILPHSIGGRLTTSSIIDGFLALGFKVSIFDELSSHNFLETFNSKKFSYLLGYDYSPLNLKVENNLNIKTINYFSDVLYDPHSGNNWENLYSYLKNKDNISFYWDEELTIVENNSQIQYLPHFVNTEIYKNLNLKPEFDIMFMGRLDTDFRLNTFLKILKNNKKVSYYGIEKHYKNALSRIENPDKHLLEGAYQGFIDNEIDMAIAINKTKIVVNFNEQGKTSLNYRTFQTAACEKLLLSDFRKDGVKFFEENFTYYNNVDDLIKKINFHLENIDVTRKKATKLRKIIEENFSHRAGAKKMVDFCNQCDF